MQISFVLAKFTLFVTAWCQFHWMIQMLRYQLVVQNLEVLDLSRVSPVKGDGPCLRDYGAVRLYVMLQPSLSRPIDE